MQRPNLARAFRSGVQSFADAMKPPAPPKPRTSEIAVASLAALASSQWNGPLPNASQLIAKHGMAKIDEMRTDPTIHATGTALFKTRARTGWKLVPHADDPEDSLHYAAECRAMLLGIRGGLKNALMEAWTAYYYGYSVTERLVEFRSTEWGDRHAIAALKTRDPKPFTFETDKFGNLTRICQTTTGMPDKYDPTDFLLYVFDKEFGNWYGRTAMEPVYAPWFIKGWLRSYIAQASERFAGGTIILGLPTNFNESVDGEQADSIMDSVQTGTGIRLPSGYTYDVKEINGAGIGRLIDGFKLMNFEIATAMLAPEQLGFTETGGGSYAKAETQASLWYGIVEDIGEDTAEDIIGEGMIRLYMAWNHPGATQLPRFEWEPLTPEDTNELAMRILDGVRLGPGGLMDWTKQDANTLRTMLHLPELPADFAPTETVVSVPSGPAVGEPEPVAEPVPQAPDEEAPPEQMADAPEVPQVAEKKARRPLTRYEQRINLADIEKRLDTITGVSIERLTAVMNDSRNTLLAGLDAILGVGENKPDPDAIADLELPGRDEFAQAVEAMLTMATLAGKGDVKAEFESVTGKTLKFADESLYLIPANMRKAFKALPLSTTERTLLGKRALFITDVNSQDVLKRVKAILYKAMARADSNWAKEQIRRVFDDYLVTGELVNEELSKAYRIERIVRTEMGQAYTDGREAMMHDPDVAPAIEAEQWTAIMEPNTCDYCAALDGEVFDKNSGPKPLAHPNCNCFMVPVFTGEEFTITTEADVRDRMRTASVADRTREWRDTPINPDNIVRAEGF